MGVSIYFMGFLMESPGPRWNIGTVIDSCEHAFIIGIVPFLFFTGMNYRHLFTPEVVRNFDPDPAKSSHGETETVIHIESRLKKEELSFSPAQLVYAVSDGNYVVFFLNIEGKIQKKIIRNSINSIGEQLPVPYYMRTHRGFIVNVKQVTSQKGNTLGYRLKLEGIDEIIPVSRQKTREFDQLLKQYR
jgi:DNA-binding LytR/AlgR family response regulator